ncbi:MAG: hypothetical protein O3B01_00690 [Planctomycetota bacterium]|nr:hypothetical protein [Planctomycetota bacterium]
MKMKIRFVVWALRDCTCLFLAFCLLILPSCRNRPHSALLWDKMKMPYHERVKQARAEQQRVLRRRGGEAQSVLHRTKEALEAAIQAIFDGREAELRGDRQTMLAKLAARQWRIEELLLLYHPEISLRMAALDQRSKSPNLIIAILQSLKLSGDAGIARGALETRRGQQEDLQLIVSKDSRSIYQTNVSGVVGLDAYFKDTKTKMLFEMELMKFRNTLLAKHGELWPWWRSTPESIPTNGCEDPSCCSV